MDALTVTASRGGAPESRHAVHLVAVRGGRAVAHAGDPALTTFYRSSAKPLQALPLVRAFADLDDAEVAIACASHQAEPAQLDAARALLARAGAAEDDLECGPQPERGERKLLHNCSGKHAGFLAVCYARGWPKEGYRLPGHELQRELLEELAAAAGARPAVAVDGCGVPTFALTLEQMARSFAALEGLEGGGRVVDAMRARPELVGGESADDTALMRAAPGWIAKRGAEGLICALSPDGLAVAAKVEDGNPRALRPALHRFLAPLGTDLGEDFAVIAIENSRGERVGEVTA